VASRPGGIDTRTCHDQDGIAHQLQRILWPDLIVEGVHQGRNVDGVEVAAQRIPIRTMAHGGILR